MWEGKGLEGEREKEIDRWLRDEKRRCDISTAQSTKKENITLCTKP